MPLLAYNIDIVKFMALLSLAKQDEQQEIEFTMSTVFCKTMLLGNVAAVIWKLHTATSTVVSHPRLQSKSTTDDTVWNDIVGCTEEAKKQERVVIDTKTALSALMRVYKNGEMCVMTVGNETLDFKISKQQHVVATASLRQVTLKPSATSLFDASAEEDDADDMNPFACDYKGFDVILPINDVLECFIAKGKEDLSLKVQTSSSGRVVLCASAVDTLSSVSHVVALPSTMQGRSYEAVFSPPAIALLKQGLKTIAALHTTSKKTTNKRKRGDAHDDDAEDDPDSTAMVTISLSNTGAPLCLAYTSTTGGDVIALYVGDKIDDGGAGDDADDDDDVN